MLRLPTLLSLLLLCIAPPALSATSESSAALFQVTVPANGNVLAAERQGLVTVLQRFVPGTVELSACGFAFNDQ